MGLARWYFYGTQSWTDAEARRSIDHDRLPRHTLRGQVQRSEDRAARRKQARKRGRR